MHSFIQCDDIWKVYRLGDVDVQALGGLSLRIEKGEFVAVMGSSGSGKSTLMNILGCLDRPTKGRYRLEGRDVGELQADQLAGIRNREIGFVFQSFNLIPRTSALENAQLPLLYRGLPLTEQRAMAVRVLQRVGLAGREHHYSTQLSGGQQQRVAIARALITSPSLLLADEPTGNLDPKTSAVIYDLFLQLQGERGISFFVATHNPDLARKADRGYRLIDGLAREIDPTDR
jgi:putative ABC transport system ATP-binding protein